jgi:hypothetical protein
MTTAEPYKTSGDYPRNQKPKKKPKTIQKKPKTIQKKGQKNPRG